mgnify:FL=1
MYEGSIGETQLPYENCASQFHFSSAENSASQECVGFFVIGKDMKKNPELTEEEKAAGVTLLEAPMAELEVVDVSDKKIEQMARGFIMGTQAIGRRHEIRAVLEERVTKRIGRKGKYLIDKLFELIDGVYTIQKESGKAIYYYKVPPNLTAIIYALDRVLGKPTQFTEHSEEKRGIILVEHVIRNLVSNPYVKNGVGKNNAGGKLGGGNGAGTAAGDGGVAAERQPQGAGAVVV